MALLEAQLAPRPLAPAGLGGVNSGWSASKYRPREGSQEVLLPDTDFFLKTEEGREVLYARILLSRVVNTLEQERPRTAGSVGVGGTTNFKGVRSEG